MSCPYTKELPDEVKELLAEGFDPTRGQEYVRALPLSRRDQRRLLVSNNWVVHLYAGAAAGDGDPFKLLNKSGKVLLEIDVCSSRLWDMNLVGGIYRCLHWAAAAKKVDELWEVRHVEPLAHSYTALGQDILNLLDPRSTLMDYHN